MFPPPLPKGLPSGIVNSPRAPRLRDAYFRPNTPKANVIRFFLMISNLERVRFGSFRFSSSDYRLVTGKRRLQAGVCTCRVRFPSPMQKRATKSISQAVLIPSSGPRIIRAVASASASRAVGARTLTATRLCSTGLPVLGSIRWDAGLIESGFGFVCL